MKLEVFGRCSGSCLERDSLFDDLISGDDQRQSTCVSRCVREVEGAVLDLGKGCRCNLCANLSVTSYTSNLRPHTLVASGLIHQLKASYTSSLRPHTLVA